jgi:hypothetical protein
VNTIYLSHVTYRSTKWTPFTCRMSLTGVADEHHLPDICHLSKYLFMPSTCHMSLIGIPSGDHLFVVCHLQQHPVQYTDSQYSVRCRPSFCHMSLTGVSGVHHLPVACQWPRYPLLCIQHTHHMLMTGGPAWWTAYTYR